MSTTGHRLRPPRLFATCDGQAPATCSDRSCEAVGGGRRWRWQQSTFGELVAELPGTMIILLFGDGSVAMVVVGLNQSGRGRRVRFAGRLADHRLGLGARRDVRRLGRRRGQRRAYQPGGDARAGAPPEVSLAQGGALHARPADRRVRGRGDRLRRLPRDDRQSRTTRCTSRVGDPEVGVHVLDLRHVRGGLSALVGQSVPGSGARHPAARRLHLRDD